MEYSLALDSLLEQIVSDQLAKLTLPSSATKQLEYARISSTGDVVLNFSQTNRLFFSVIGIPLIDTVMQDPTRFMRSQPIPDVTPREMPSMVQLTVCAPPDVENEDVSRLCQLIPVRKSASCADGGNLSGLVRATQPRPVTAVIRCIELDRCERVSLAGGRALRDAARRNTFLQIVSVYGCSINPGTEAQLARALKANVDRVVKAAGCLAPLPPPDAAMAATRFYEQASPLDLSPTTPHGGTDVSTEPDDNERYFFRDVLHHDSRQSANRNYGQHLVRYPLLNSILA